MLIILLIIQIPTILLDPRVYTKRAWVYFLTPQIVQFQFTVDISFPLSIFILNPDALYVCAFKDMIPVTVRSASMLLGFGR